MLKQVAAMASALGLTLALLAPPAGADRYGYNQSPHTEWMQKLRFVGSVGFDSSGVINFLTFRDGSSKSGWNWQLGASYQVQEPIFVEAGLMGWTLGRDNQDDAKEFSIAGSVGVKLDANEFGVGFVPRGGRLFARRFLQGNVDGKGPMAQVDIVFPSVGGTRSFMALNIGYGF